jgi:hypothetical protein
MLCAQVSSEAKCLTEMKNLMRDSTLAAYVMSRGELEKSEEVWARR